MRGAYARFEFCSGSRKAALVSSSMYDPKFARSNRLNTSKMPSIDSRPASRNALLQPQVDAMDRVADERVARDDRAVRTESLRRRRPGSDVAGR